MVPKKDQLFLWKTSVVAEHLRVRWLDNGPSSRVPGEFSLAGFRASDICCRRMSDTNSARSTLIRNEQTKLLASALDRASTTLGAGTLFPLWQLYRNDSAHPALYELSAGGFILGAVGLHWLARRVLRGLR
jgi:hypothetical protein